MIYLKTLNRLNKVSYIYTYKFINGLFIKKVYVGLCSNNGLILFNKNVVIKKLKHNYKKDNIFKFIGVNKIW
jgi:hypothetical protein